jgi:aspartate/methionine/tyrosine aminotransferase
MMDMNMQPFALERYFSKYEFSAKYLLSASDCESLSMQELLSMADDESRNLWHNLKLGYTETLGHPLLLEEILKFYRTLTPKHVLVAAPEELIFIAMQSLLSRGDHLIVTTPAYQSLHEIASSIGCIVEPWQLHPTNDGWRLDLQYLADHVTDKTRLIIINFPHNPTGHHISDVEQRDIVRIARKHNVAIFSDEMYRGAEYRTADRLPSVVDEYERGISLWGLSKSFALPGLRIGWLASNDANFLAKCLGLRDYLTICNSAPGEILGLIALRQRETILRRTRGILAKNLEIANSFFGRHPESFSWLKPKAGSIAFPILRKNISIETFCKNLVESKGLLVTPGSLFQYSGNHFRIGMGRTNFAEALGILETSL